jgi:hypothetical protein
MPNEKVSLTEAKTEVMISKGEGQYRTTIGFLDVRIDWFSADPVDWMVRGSVFVEVKIAPIGVGDILRQINLYREYASAVPARDTREHLRGTVSTAWVLATSFQLDAGQTETLQGAGITLIRLGEGFEKWFAERQKRPAPKPEQF